MARLFSVVIEARLLDNASLSPRQRGFRPGKGCLVNCTILNKAIHLGKHSRLVGVQLDVSTAFDTVYHAAVAAVMSSHWVPLCLQNTVSNMYADGTNSFGHLDASITLRRGVKQGDPFSPLLFNLVLNPLMQQLRQ